MATLPVQNYAVGSYSLKALCRLVGIACLAGFLIDLFVLTFPPAFGSLEWRVGFMQQVSDRSIILLFGLALMMYSILDYRLWRRRFALFCLILGVVMSVSCVLVIRDSLTLQQQAMTSIEKRATDLQTQIKNVQANPTTNQKITPEQIEQASKLLSNQAESLKQNAKNSTIKTGISSVGNLVVVGIALISLGQYGARPPRD